MNTSAIHAERSLSRRPFSWHRTRVWIASLAAATVILGVAAFGADYYSLPLAERAVSAKHDLLRPSGAIGLRLGMFGVFLFFCLYMYPLRKKWRWLAKFGKTKNWLDFHVLFGITAPLVITLHSSLKFQGIAGVAYWLMIAVMASGIVGRYLYAKIPRSLNSAELSLDELELTARQLATELEAHPAFASTDLDRAFRLPSVEDVSHHSLIRVLVMMLWLDFTSMFRASRLRRSAMSAVSCLLTLGGLLPSRNASLEHAVKLVRQRLRIQTRIVFLNRTNQIFNLWHVVHRPFSYAFLTLALAHILFMVMLGYY